MPSEHSPVSSVLGATEKGTGPGDIVDGAGDDTDSNYASGLRLAVITIALCLSVFLMALDNTIIVTAIPRITDDFGALNDIGWYGSAYFLTTCSFQLLFGKLYTFFSIKWVFLAAIATFEVGSLICGAAPSSTALIVGRAISGVGSAGIFSGAVVVVVYTVPLEKRPVYNGIFGAIYGLASIAGPLMGGAFTDHITWRFCFYINLPIGALTLIVMAMFFQSPNRKGEASVGFRELINKFDPFGTAVFIPAIVCLLLALQWGGSQYAWSDGRIISLFILFGLLMCIFIGIQFWKKDDATIPPRIMSQRSVACGSFFSFVLGAAFFTMLFFLPVWFQAIKGVNATNSGIRNLPMILGLVIMSILSGAGTTAVGYYTPFMILSSILLAVGAGLLSTFEVDTGSATWIGYQIIFGFGVGTGMQLSLVAVQTVLALDDVPIGTSIIILAQSLGGAIFVSVGQNIFTNHLLSGLAAAVPNLNPELVLHTGATRLKDTIDPALLSSVISAYNRALDDSFYVVVALASLSFVGAIGMEWKSVKGKKVDGVLA